MTKQLLSLLVPEVFIEEVSNAIGGENKFIKRYNLIFAGYLDIVGFTELSGRLSSEKLIRLLNKIYSWFDKICHEYQIIKFRTYGDAYLAIKILHDEPTETETETEPTTTEFEFERHSTQICDFGFTLIDLLKRITKEKVQIRFGISASPGYLALIGQKRVSLDCYGKVFIESKALEQSCLPGMINVSKSIFESVKNDYICVRTSKIIVCHSNEFEHMILKRIKNESNEIIDNLLNEKSKEEKGMNLNSIKIETNGRCVDTESITSTSLRLSFEEQELQPMNLKVESFSHISFTRVFQMLYQSIFREKQYFSFKTTSYRDVFPSIIISIAQKLFILSHYLQINNWNQTKILICVGLFLFSIFFRFLCVIVMVKLRIIRKKISQSNNEKTTTKEVLHRLSRILFTFVAPLVNIPLILGVIIYDNYMPEDTISPFYFGNMLFSFSLIYMDYGKSLIQKIVSSSIICVLYMSLCVFSLISNQFDPKLNMLFYLPFLIMFWLPMILLENVKRRSFDKDKDIKNSLKRMKQGEEKREIVLRSILPQWVVKRIMCNQKMIRNAQKRGVIAFVEIRGWYKCFVKEEKHSIESLMTLFSQFDEFITYPNFEKVKSMENMYMFVSNNELQSTSSSKFLSALKTLYFIFKDSKLSKECNIVTGVHCGEYSSGIVGSTTINYDILSQDVNEAARLCQNGKNGLIHASNEFVTGLRDGKEYLENLEKRILVMKGIGEVETYQFGYT